jgi:hypothetical protein
MRVSPTRVDWIHTLTIDCTDGNVRLNVTRVQRRKMSGTLSTIALRYTRLACHRSDEARASLR